MADLSKGDRVSWKAGQGRVTGTIERVITGSATVAGRKVKATSDDPRYVVKNEKTGKSTVRKGDGLRALTPAAKAPAARKPAATPSQAGPGRNRPLLVAAGVLAVLAAIALTVVLIDGGEDGADAQDAEAAEAALERTDEAMEAVIATSKSESLRSVAEAQLPYGKFRDEVLRPAAEAEASFEAERRHYAAATEAIGEARAALDHSQDDLTAPEDTRDEAEAYLSDARDFLDRYEDAIVFLQEALILDRMAELGYVGDEVADDSVGAAREAVAAEIARLKDIARRYEKLEAPSDIEDLAAAMRALNELRLRQQQELAAFIDGVGSGSGAISRDDIRIEAGPPARRLRVALAALQERSELSAQIAELEAESEELARALDEL